jgi:hypothetical protein
MMVLTGCFGERPVSPGQIIAQVGPDVLTHQEAVDAIPYAVWESDSVKALSDFANSWTIHKLMVKEATRLGLDRLDEVSRQIELNRDGILVETLRDRALNTLDDEMTVTEAEIQEYYDKYSNQFRLNERHVRVRHITTARLEQAIAAKRDLQDGMSWENVVAQYSNDTEFALQSSNQIRPVSSAISSTPVMQAYLSSLGVGAISAVREFNGDYHFIQLVESYAPGSVPEISWLKERIFEWLIIEKRRRALLAYEQNLLLQAQSAGTVRIQLNP